jgi:hypothetical protein
VGIVIALTSSSAQAVAVAIAVGLVLIAYAWFKFIKAVTTKAIGLVVILGLVLGMWNERSSIKQCALDVTKGVKTPKDCAFFGVWDLKFPGITKTTTP